MKLGEFDYALPPELIAQRPEERRDGSRLLTLDRRSGGVTHRGFDELPELLSPGDLLVVNDVRVRPARLKGRKASGGRVELLLTEFVADEGAACVWDCLLQVSRPPAVGAAIELDDGPRALVVGRSGEGWRLRFEVGPAEVEAHMDRHGAMPLPPYIRRDEDDRRSIEDRERYQTVYAARDGAVAAPTAGLHFTRGLLERLKEHGVELAKLTLRVGPGTFLPVRTDEVEHHRMHAEGFEVPRAAAEAVERARARSGRVIAVGTTAVRTLEHQASEGGRISAGEGRTELFIYPGFEFRVVDAMITNFHLPRSTLLMLVSAFAGREQVLEAYRRAVDEGYRFFSYGDAMWIQ